MAEQPANNTSDEIDLGQLFQLIGKGLNRVFLVFLRLFIYFKKNGLILFGLIFIGVVAGFGLKQLSEKKMKTEVIVRPNIDSKDYLYDVVAEIQANVKSKNQAFFEPLGIDIKALEGFEVTVESLRDKNTKLEDELKYLELLKGLNISGTVSDVIRNEILSRNSLNHKITFSYEENTKGHEGAIILMEYINSNPYFNSLIEIYLRNAQKRIEENQSLINQLDILITQYSKNLASKDKNTGDGRIFFENEEQLDIRKLFDLKNELIRDIESKKIELKTREKTIKIINFGNVQEVQKPFFKKTLVITPLLLTFGFFLFSIFKYLDQKSKTL